MIKQLLSSLILLSALTPASAQNSVSVDLTNKLLVNADFELIQDENGAIVPIGATGVNKQVPYGWSTNYPEFGLTSSYGVNGDATYLHGHGLTWFRLQENVNGSTVGFPSANDPNRPDIKENWKLFQTIPANKLEPGLYKISCLLWQEYRKKGDNKIIDAYKNSGCDYTELLGGCCLFATAGEGDNAHTNVQYYGKNADYVGTDKDGNAASNLTATDNVVTFANYAPGVGNSYILRPLVVYIQVNKGESLQLGIRTSCLDRNGNPRGIGTGWFKADDFHVEKVLSQPALDPDAFTNQNIQNNSFELNPDGEPANGQQITDLPYGWNVENESDDYGIHPNFVRILDGNECAYFNAKENPISDLALYQYVDAGKLEPGIYEVSCRLWQPRASKNGATQFGQCRLYATDGTTSYVQYYGKSSEYDKNLTSGEIASYAGYPGWSDRSASWERDRQLHEMFVDFPLQPTTDNATPSFEFGIRSGAMKADGTIDKTNGTFHVDYFRFYKKSNLTDTLFATKANDVKTLNYKVRFTLEHGLKNGSWGTICLPIALNETDLHTIFGQNVKVAAFDRADGTTLYFTSVKSIEAGVPYIICPDDVVPSPLTIDDVVISNAVPATVVKDGYSFVGTFNPVDIKANDATKLTIDAEGKAVATTSDIQVNAASAYILNPSSQNLTIVIDNPATGISSINKNECTGTQNYYNVSGQRVEKNHKGIIILNGKKWINK